MTCLLFDGYLGELLHEFESFLTVDEGGEVVFFVSLFLAFIATCAHQDPKSKSTCLQGKMLHNSQRRPCTMMEAHILSQYKPKSGCTLLKVLAVIKVQSPLHSSYQFSGVGALQL